MRTGPVILLLLGAVGTLRAGFLYDGIGPANAPWPGGTIPYVIDPALDAAQRQTYLDGIREWELAGNLHFIPRTTEAQYVLFKYNPSGPNLVSGSHPQTVEISSLTRAQICHETGHSLGLTHEHIRPDRDTRVTVLTDNISSGNAFWFDIDPTGELNGAYDFESVMHFGRDLFSVSPGMLDTLEVKPGFERYQVRMGNFALSPGDRAAVASIYGAVTLSPVVTHTGDTGPGSLRAALYYATDHPGTTITFNIPPTDLNFSAGTFTIYNTGHLPPLVTPGTIIDAMSQPGYTDRPLVFIDGSEILAASGDPPGLMIYASGCTVKGLGFTRSRWVGVALLHPDCTGNAIASCWSGPAASGNSPLANAKQGIQISGGAHHNLIGPGNLLSGNTEYGIWISDAGTTGNTILGNRIGTRADGGRALANGLGGLIVTDAAHGNVIDGNVISGNQDAGIWLTGEGVDDNVVRCNLIGTNTAGTAPVPNSSTGLYVIAGASDNRIAENVISGNGSGFGYGMAIIDAATTGTIVEDNLIGVLRNGGALGNPTAGIAIWGGAKNSLIRRNLIRHNGSYGIALFDTPTEGHTFSANATSGNGFADLWTGTSNRGQAAPVLTTAEATAGGIHLSGSLSATASSSHRIEFFSGNRFLGAKDGVLTDGGGFAAFDETLPATLPAGSEIRATATHQSQGDTSAFSFSIPLTMTDGDGDGMPDAYENAKGLQAGVNDAADDADGDGASNLAEYLAGSHPKDGTDVFKPLSVTRAGNQLTLRFRSAAGRTYQIQESTTLDGGSWRILYPVLHATDGELEVVTEFTTTTPKKFHRALLLE